MKQNTKLPNNMETKPFSFDRQMRHSIERMGSQPKPVSMTTKVPAPKLHHLDYTRE